MDNKIFTYTRQGKDNQDQPTTVWVEHVPYSGALEFSTPAKTYNKTTGTIEQKTDGAQVLADTHWQGTVVLDEQDRDVSVYNQNF